MPKKKPAKELTTEEVMKRIFPKEIRDRLQTVADGQKDEDTRQDQSQDKDTRS